MKKINAPTILIFIRNFLLFFVTIGFIVSCCMILFLKTLASSMDLILTSANIQLASRLTLLNVFVLTILFMLIDYIRKIYTVDRPVKTITDATEKIMTGDFSVKIDYLHNMGAEGFNKIITAINAMSQELSSVETLRTDFISNVSHEMKTPLAVMQNFSTLLQADELSDDKRIEYAKGIGDACKRLSNMMTNILKLNKLENQQIFTDVETFDLGEQICECFLQYENLWEKYDIEIETDIEDDVKVNADKELLSLVWNNLFSNAFKFTDEGGKVSVSLKSDDKYAYVKVKDTGCGISKEVGEHIFEKFYQGDTSHSTRGNGLGLALVKRVVDIMQGEISVESVVNEGSTFTVKIEKG